MISCLELKIRIFKLEVRESCQSLTLDSHLPSSRTCEYWIWSTERFFQAFALLFEHLLNIFFYLYVILKKCLFFIRTIHVNLITLYTATCRWSVEGRNMSSHSKESGLILALRTFDLAFIKNGKVIAGKIQAAFVKSHHDEDELVLGPSNKFIKS